MRLMAGSPCHPKLRCRHGQFSIEYRPIHHHSPQVVVSRCSPSISIVLVGVRPCRNHWKNAVKRHLTCDGCISSGKVNSAGLGLIGIRETLCGLQGLSDLPPDPTRSAQCSATSAFASIGCSLLLFTCPVLAKRDPTSERLEKRARLHTHFKS